MNYGHRLLFAPTICLPIRGTSTMLGPGSKVTSVQRRVVVPRQKVLRRSSSEMLVKLTVKIKRDSKRMENIVLLLVGP